MREYTLRIALLALLVGELATLSNASTNASQGICVDQEVELQEHAGGYTTYPLLEHAYSYICGLFWKKCTNTTYRYSSKPEVQHVNHVVTITSEKEICCNGFSGIPPNCTPVCEPGCENGGECTSPGVCLCLEGWAGAYCEEALCSPPCENGGQCIAPDVCQCLPTWTGPQCETVTVPVISSSERTSATSLRVKLEEVTVNQTIGVVNAHKLVIKEMQAGECSSTVFRVLDDTVKLEVLVDGLDPQKMYCIYAAAKTVAMVSDFSEPTPVPLYVNTPLELTLQVNRQIVTNLDCQGLTQAITNEITDGINKVGEFFTTRDNFQPEYITNTKWNCSLEYMVNTPVKVAFRFTLISTDIINSTELASLLKYWVREQSVRFREGDIYITVDSAECIDDHYIGPNTVICTNTPYGEHPPVPRRFYIQSIVITVFIVLVGVGCFVVFFVFVVWVIKYKNRNKVKDISDKRQK